MMHGRPPLGRALKSPFDVDEASLGSILWRYNGRGLFDPPPSADWPLTHLYFYNP